VRADDTEFQQNLYLDNAPLEPPICHDHDATTARYFFSLGLFILRLGTMLRRPDASTRRRGLNGAIISFNWQLPMPPFNVFLGQRRDFRTTWSSGTHRRVSRIYQVAAQPRTKTKELYSVPMD
jgi:hypothetical protein